MTDLDFTRRALITVVIVAFAAALWMLSEVLLLIFAAVLVAFVLRALARPIENGGVGRTAAVSVAAILSATLIIAAGIFFGSTISEQAQALADNFREALTLVTTQVQASALGRYFETIEPGSGAASFIGTFLSWGVSLGQAIVGFVVALVGGFYLAVSQSNYRDGLLKLVPPSYRANVTATLSDIGEALHRWIHGQLLAMIIVAVLTAIGLMLAGVKSAVALGVLSGLANFVPYIGSLAAGVVALTIAASQGGETLLYAAVAILVVQQIESNVITPLVVGRAVSIEPAVGLFALVAMGTLFGPLGILLGFPLTIVADIAIRRLYVRDTLDTDVEILGAPAQRSDSDATS